VPPPGYHMSTLCTELSNAFKVECVHNRVQHVIENHRVSIMKFKNAASSLYWTTLRSWRGRDNAMNSYETEEMAEITAKWSALQWQVHRQLFFLLFMSVTKIFGFNFCPLDRQQTTSNRQQMDKLKYLTLLWVCVHGVKKIERVHKEFSVNS